MNDLINNWSVQVAGMLVITAATTAVFWIAQGFDAALPVALLLLAFTALVQGKIDATVSQPADLYAKYALSYLKAAIEGRTFKPGRTDHDSTIVQIRDGVLEDQLSAPLVTAGGGTYGGVPSLRSDDTSLWGNNP